MNREEEETSDIGLPYNGNLQEAIRMQDREAVKNLLSRRKSENGSNDHNETKSDQRNALCEALEALGFSRMQIMESVEINASEGAAVKCLLDSKRHFPSPRRKERKDHSHQSPKAFQTEDRVTSHMLGGLDPDSIYTLLQCCVENPTISQTVVFSILKQLVSLRTASTLSMSACTWMQSMLINGFVEEVQCLLGVMDSPQFSSDTTSASCLDERSPTDHLLSSYMCPITREILVEPVTLQVYIMDYSQSSFLTSSAYLEIVWT